MARLGLGQHGDHALAVSIQYLPRHAKPEARHGRAHRLDIDRVGHDRMIDRQIARPLPRHAEHHDFVTGRSEEHTSELQSLMRTSYAYSCLKKKNNKLHT